MARINPGSRVLIALVGAIAAGSGSGGEALAADPLPTGSPILDDLDRARTLTPPPNTLGGVVEVREEEPEEPPALARDVMMVVAHGRWATMPEFMLGIVFEHQQPLTSASAGLAIEFGDLDSAMWSIELDWTSLVPEAGNWLEVGVDPAGASYAQSGLHMFSLDATYRRQFPFTRDFRAMLGGGLGVGVLTGSFETAEVLPTCTEPVEACAHWPRATDDVADMPTRIVPVLHISLGLEVDLGEGFSLRAEGGFRNLFFAGLSLGKAL